MQTPLFVTTGEPSGIGPDVSILAALANAPVVLIGDIDMLQARATQLGLTCSFEVYNGVFLPSKNNIQVLSHPVNVNVVPGRLDVGNARYVIHLLEIGLNAVNQGHCRGLVTAPVHKAIINEAGIPFSGHTEWFMQKSHVDEVVMMLCSSKMKVALVTTHLPLSDVSSFITKEKLKRVIGILGESLIHQFGIASPNIRVAGLNPHAGEQGHMGLEELSIIQPIINEMKTIYPNLSGCYPADTLFTSHYIDSTDAFLAMYHDQGLPVIKYASFDDAVNITLGLPFVRTSPDHGTALALAATGKITSRSMMEAVTWADRLSMLYSDKDKT